MWCKEIKIHTTIPGLRQGTATIQPGSMILKEKLDKGRLN
jgi:hypothetical protein